MSARYISRWNFFLRYSLFFAVMLMLAVAEAQTGSQGSVPAVPHLVRFGGIMKDESGHPITGIKGVTFALYNVQEGGAALWLETQNVSPDSNGRYTVSLGITKTDGIPIDLFTSGEARWLGVQPDGQAEQARVLLLSVPYALKAADAETIRGLPPSAFVLATAPVYADLLGTTSVAPSGVAPSAPPPASVTGSGTVNFIPLWTSTTNIGNSALFQVSGKVGIGTTTPGATLDVKGTTTIEGLFTLPATGVATATSGKASQASDLIASSFNSSTSTAVNQTFQWKAEPTGNNTSAPSGTLNLLFGSGTSSPTETGLKLSSKGIFSFASGQTFPGAGTITGITAGPGLTGGGTSGILTLSLLKTCSVNQVLQWNGTTWTCTTIGGSGTITGVTAGTDLTGGGTSGNVTLNLNTTATDARYAQLNANNTFTKTMTFAAGQTFPGAGTVTSVGLTAPVSDFTVSGSPVTGAGTLNFGWTVAPTSANTANAIVKRDSLGNFNANTVTTGSLVSSALTSTTISAGSVSATNLTATGTVQGGAGNFGLGVTASTSADADYAVGILGEQLALTKAGIGVEGYGNSTHGIGVYGNAYSQSNEGANSGTFFPVGVWGDTSLSAGVGVFGSVDDGTAANLVNNSFTYDTLDLINNDPTGTGILYVGWGAGVPTSLIDMNGNLDLNGSISKAGGSFKIDHPLDPANKYLYHSFVESPDMMNIYNGVVMLDDAGMATVVLPNWFEALNRDFRYQLTAIGAPGPSLYIAEEVTGNQFKIAGGRPASKVSWQVTGVRHDAWANAHRIPLEVEKAGSAKGKYMHPELFGLARGEFSIISKTPRPRRATGKK